MTTTLLTGDKDLANPYVVSSMQSAFHDDAEKKWIDDKKNKVKAKPAASDKVVAQLRENVSKCTCLWTHGSFKCLFGGVSSSDGLLLLSARKKPRSK